MTLNSSINSTTNSGFNPLHVFVSAIFLFTLGLLLVIYPAHSQAGDTDKKILIIYQKAHGFTQQLIEQLQQDISASGFQTEQMILKHEQLNLLKITNQDLLISIGSQTTERLLKANIKTPILSALIPRHISKSLRAKHKYNENWSSLLIDHPIDRQFNLISAVLGKQKNIGTLLGPYTKDLHKTLNNVSTKTTHNINIKEIKTTDQLTASLKSLNHTEDVLLTLPDPIIYNKSTMRGILLLAYRNKLPIIGFSKSYVKAGAIAAIYSEPEQISQQITRITNSILTNKNFKHKTYYPDDFSVAVNRKIARSLGIKINTQKVITKQIKMAEENR